MTKMIPATDVAKAIRSIRRAFRGEGGLRFTDVYQLLDNLELWAAQDNLSDADFGKEANIFGVVYDTVLGRLYRHFYLDMVAYFPDLVRDTIPLGKFVADWAANGRPSAKTSAHLPAPAVITARYPDIATVRAYPVTLLDEAITAYLNNYVHAA